MTFFSTFTKLARSLASFLSLWPNPRTACDTAAFKRLFEALDCDELVAVDANGATALVPHRSDPTHRDKDLRFAKEGTQVLIRQMEERRMPPGPPLHRLRVDSDFIYVDL